MRKLIGILVGAAIACSVPVAPSAVAATEFGDECAADAAEPDYTFLQLARGSGSALPLMAPNAGVVTQWRVHVAPGFVVEAAPIRLKVFRATGNAGEFQVVGESTDGAVGNAPGFAYKTRIAVLTDDRLGLYGAQSEGTLACNTGAPEDELGFLHGTAPLGTIQTFASQAGFRVPVSATLEPDLDGDGYGDETQDGCPTSGETSGACPPRVTLRVRAEVRKRSILLRVRPSGEASVDVYGQVGWNFKPRPENDRARASRKGTKRLIVGLDGGTKDVVPGATTRFTIRLPKPVKLRLGRLTRQESIRAKLTLHAADPAGIARNTRLRVTLHGWRPLR